MEWNPLKCRRNFSTTKFKKIDPYEKQSWYRLHTTAYNVFSSWDKENIGQKKVLMLYVLKEELPFSEFFLIIQ